MFSFHTHSALSTTQAKILQANSPIKYCLTSSETSHSFEQYIGELSRKLAIPTQQRIKSQNDDVLDCMLLSPELTAIAPNSFIQQLVIYQDEALAIGIAPSLSPVADILANVANNNVDTDTRFEESHWFFDYFWFWLATFVLVALFLAYRYYTLALHSLMLDSKNFELDLKNKALLDLQEQLRARNKKLEYLSTHDSLTSLANRHFFNETVLKELNRAVRHNSQLSLLLIDMDNFKAINDTYGHSEGDKVLIETAQVLKKQVRSIDIVGRWGGEEFIILLPNTSLKDATMLANRICEAVMEQNITPVQKISCSIGVSRFKDGDSLDTVFIRADKALYEAKALGKNRAESLE
ncbi:GGDEF domain-containing protein [Neptunicella marina]|uniref:diguanylate cyclase n=1 Tax=Neptunicella marina TaxID=2125989 RepID=A0A8J6M2U3_9ALTE|nr:GGDEF domain-containing protein [Neptunicella marina]